MSRLRLGNNYRRIEKQLAQITAQRDSIGAQMITLLDGAAFRGHKIDHSQAHRLEQKGDALIARARGLASQS